jgi:hypothetical protein
MKNKKEKCIDMKSGTVNDDLLTYSTDHEYLLLGQDEEYLDFHIADIDMNAGMSDSRYMNINYMK